MRNLQAIGHGCGAAGAIVGATASSIGGNWFACAWAALCLFWIATSWANARPRRSVETITVRLTADTRDFDAAVKRSAAAASRVRL